MKSNSKATGTCSMEAMPLRGYKNVKKGLKDSPFLVVLYFRDCALIGFPRQYSMGYIIALDANWGAWMSKHSESIFVIEEKVI